MGPSAVAVRGAAIISLLVVLAVAACSTHHVPTSPTRVTATAHPGFIRIEWVDNSADEIVFVVYRQEADDVTFASTSRTRLVTVPANTTRHDDHAVTLGKEYGYAVAALGPDGESSAAGQLGAPLTPLNQPPIIHGFTATPDHGTVPLAVAFSWDVDDPDGHTLTCTLDPGDGGTPYDIADCTGTSTRTHTYATEGPFEALLEVQDGHGGRDSASLTIDEPYAPSGPTDVTVEPQPGFLTVSWRDTTPDETAFIVYRASLEDDGDGTLLERARVPAGTTRFEDHDVTFGRLYRYAVAAVGPEDASAASEQRGSPVGPLNQPPVIDGFSAIPNHGMAPLTLEFAWIVSDPDGHLLTGTLDPGDGGAPDDIADCTATTALEHTYSTEGTGYATLEVQDGHGGSAKASALFTVEPREINGVRVSGSDAPGMEAYDALITEVMARYDIPGGAVAVVNDGRLVFAHGYGWSDVENRIAVQPDDLFRIASLSKPITAAAILTLYEEGRLGLDDPAFGYLTDLEPPDGATVDPRLASITIAQLLQHSGGWDSALTFDPMFRSHTIAQAMGAPEPASSESIIRYMLGQPLQFDPGTRYAYSNFGYNVLGRVLERVTGTPLRSVGAAARARSCRCAAHGAGSHRALPPCTWRGALLRATRRADRSRIGDLGLPRRGSGARAVRRLLPRGDGLARRLDRVHRRPPALPRRNRRAAGTARYPRAHDPRAHDRPTAGHQRHLAGLRELVRHGVDGATLGRGRDVVAQRSTSWYNVRSRSDAERRGVGGMLQRAHQRLRGRPRQRLGPGEGRGHELAQHRPVPVVPLT